MDATTARGHHRPVADGKSAWRRLKLRPWSWQEMPASFDRTKETSLDDTTNTATEPRARRPAWCQHHELAGTGPARGRVRGHRRQRPLPPDGRRPPARTHAAPAAGRSQDGRLPRRQRHVSLQAGSAGTARRGGARSAPDRGGQHRDDRARRPDLRLQHRLQRLRAGLRPRVGADRGGRGAASSRP